MIFPTLCRVGMLPKCDRVRNLRCRALSQGLGWRLRAAELNLLNWFVVVVPSVYSQSMVPVGCPSPEFPCSTVPVSGLVSVSVSARGGGRMNGAAETERQPTGNSETKPRVTEHQGSDARIQIKRRIAIPVFVKPNMVKIQKCILSWP